MISIYNLAHLFKPITAKPKNTHEYVEIMPSNVLQPYIRCFWGSPRPITKFKQANNIVQSNLIIPDTCMDIIVEIDYLTNKVSSVFCGINNAPFQNFISNRNAIISIFAIRFNFWAIHLFTDNCMNGAMNAFTEVEEYFSDFRKSLEIMLIDKTTIEERIPIVEDYLIRCLNKNRRTNDHILNTVYYILKTKGIVPISELCQRNIISQRQLERLFKEYIGISPKKTADLVRFQNVWQDIYYSNECNLQDIVYRYMFTDQPHFTNYFKKYFGVTPLQALARARQ